MIAHIVRRARDRAVPPGTGILHRLPAGSSSRPSRFGALLLSLYPHDPISIAVSLLIVVGLYGVSGMPLRVLLVEMWRLRWIVLVLTAALVIFVSPVAAWISTGRVLAVLLLAGCSRSPPGWQTLLEVLHRLLRPLRRVGADPEAMALTISLTLATIR